MKKENLIAILFLFMVAACCDDPQDVIEECTDNACFNLSDLNTHTDHFLPFILYNDIETECSKIVLNDEEISLKYGHSLEFKKTGFFEMILFYKDSQNASDTILFTLGTAEREPAEWGIETWIPVEFTSGIDYSGDIDLVYPKRYMAGMGVPFIVLASEGGIPVEGYYTASFNHSSEFNIKHGVGSVMIDAANMSTVQSITLAGQEVQAELQKVTEFTQQLGGVISIPYTVADNSVVRISEDLNISATGSLVIGEGALILVDEGINIYNEGAIIINGTSENPVLISCSDAGSYWGGFISTGGEAIIRASNTIFCQSGYHDSGEYAGWGHAKRQALFYTSESELHLDHCYMTDHIGQIFYPLNSVLTFESILVQRAKTSGQLNYSEVSIENSTFTDFPDDSYVYKDQDNDALYINFSDVSINNCKFMYAKDDGIDSGGDEGGTVNIINTLFEACFHEGAALSSKNSVSKVHNFTNCTFYNCGQGLELGFSSPQHSVNIQNCQFLDNGIGIRYGDNYSWSLVNGLVQVMNSQSLGNGRDVWNMVRNNWSPKLEQMIFTNVQISKYTSQYPNIEVINYR